MDFEQLGAFYLGHVVEGGEVRRDRPLLYDAKDLTTHGLCVGMTGSGKTGLCVTLLEEAAIDGVPAIAIDPKGDLGNLLLSFPELSPDDFEPWVDDAEATREGRTRRQHAEALAARWRKGLADSGQGPARVARFRDAADVAIYTPGSDAGLPLSVLRSLSAPASALRGDGDAVRERIGGAVSGLLTLLGLDADPLRSREHILVSLLVQRAWDAGQDVELARLIREIQKPPIDRVGVMDLETFFPASARAGLAMALNNLVASPGFGAWAQGEPLDVARLLWTPEGRPRISVLSIAHLSESERMFFVTLLLNEVVAWMRTQPGTSSLRALLYMDEIFGFFPPVREPPSKKPMLTLLKQARAHGLGVLLATQNPVDLDYKGLSNCGTWFLGRLQTERDVARVLEGLEGASAASGRGFDRAATEATLAGLPGRTFLMNDVHEDAPVLFHTRWALSYLRGPLTRLEIKRLMGERRQAEAPTAPEPVQVAPEVLRPSVPSHVTERFVHTDAPSADIAYRPGLVATAHLHYTHRYADIDEWLSPVVLVPWDPSSALPRFEHATLLRPDQIALEEEPREGVPFGALPPLGKASLRSAEKALADHLYRSQTLPVFHCRPLKAWSAFGEDRAAMQARVQHAAREQRDLEVARLRERWAGRLAALQERIRKAEAKVERERSQASRAKVDTAISVGSTVLGALLGRRVVRSAGAAARSAGRAAGQGGDVDRAEADVRALRAQLADMEREFEGEIAALRGSLPELPIEEREVAPRKQDLSLVEPCLVWMPAPRA